MPDLDDPLQTVAKDSAAVENNNGLADSPQAPPPQPSFAEMRSSPRKQFQYSQRIAPMLSKILPGVDDYLEVECNDISCGGISFYLKRSPGCEYFAIALGQKPTITLLVARVAYIREVNHNDQRMYLVGCKFTDRVEE